MYLAKNLRRLRLEKGLTQEELAEYVRVTGQAVSKWERDECYPDITLLPGLANVFGVTVDALLGMEEINDREKKCHIHARTSILQQRGDYQEVADFLEEALKTYPSDLGLQGAHAISLALAGDDAEAYTRAVKIHEHIMAEGSSDKHRGTTAAVLCHLYHYTGMTEKAVELARSRPHTVEARELLLPYFLPQPERDEYLRKYLPGIFVRIAKLIDSSEISQEDQLRSAFFGTDICSEKADFERAIAVICEFMAGTR